MIHLSPSDRAYIGKRIQNRRKYLGITQERLAEMVDISTVHMCRVEAGAQPSLELLILLAQVLELPMDELVGNISGENVIANKTCLLLLSRTEREQRMLFQLLEDLCATMDRHDNPKDPFYR